MRCDISKAEAIFGWMLPEELEWLAFEASRHKAIIEIGCYMGRSTRVLGDHALGKVWAVDHWEGPPEINPPIHAPESLYPAFCENLKDLIPHKVEPVRMHSVEAAKVLEGPFDMIFIDGEHNAVGFENDLRAWSKLLVPGGLLCGHDAEWAGVSSVRRNVLPPHMTGVGGIWAVDNFSRLKD